MANLKSIKTKILSYKKTGTVTHAMEAVSAVKMRKGQERALSGRAYAAAALSVLERLSATADIARHPLMRERDLGTQDVVVYAFGRKGGEYFTSRGYSVESVRTNVSDGISEDEMRDMTAAIIGRGDIASVLVAYQNFISTFY